MTAVLFAGAALLGGLLAFVAAVGRADTRRNARLEEAAAWHEARGYAPVILCDSCMVRPAEVAVVVRGRGFRVCTGCAPVSAPLALGGGAA